MGKPQHLYKYEAFSVRSLLNLKCQTLHFGAPAYFNDPYDCAITARVREPTDEEIEEFRQKYTEIEQIPSLAREQLQVLPKQQLKDWLLRVIQQTVTRIAEENIRKRGVTCFSEVNNELLMWSHYAEKYTGFCLEFDTNFEPFSKVRKVKYSSSMPSLSVTDALVHNQYEQFLELYCTKSAAWSYEREWRCIHHEAGTDWTYEAKALTAIYFGPEINPAAMEIICLILQGQNADIKFFRGARANDNFSVQFHSFEYTSHLKAKEMGIIT